MITVPERYRQRDRHPDCRITALCVASHGKKQVKKIN